MILRLKRKYHYSLVTGLIGVCISSEILFEDLSKLIVIPLLCTAFVLNALRFNKNKKEVF